MITWILVISGSAGKFLKVEKNGQEINVIKEFSHPKTAKKSIDETTKTHGTLGHAIDYDGEIEQYERSVFAKEIAEFLSKIVTHQGKSDNLIFVAPAKMLGEIRHATMHLIKHTNVYELHKNLLPQRLSDKEIIEIIRHELDIAHL